MKNWIWAVCLLVGLSACATTKPAPIAPEMTFKHLAPLNLNVAVIDIVDESTTPPSGKNVAYNFPVSPKKALDIWVKDRLRASGASGVARVKVLEASALEEKLKTKSGVSGLFSNDLSEKYTSALNVVIELYDHNGASTGFASASASRYITVNEDLSLLEREKKWYEMVEQLMADFDGVMSDKLAPFVMP